jgi:putative PIN family toxin of toxin-antitoxin system
MRITTDTNVLVSAFIAKQGHPASLLEAILTLEDMHLILSRPILRELGEVLMREEVTARFPYTERDVDILVNTLSRSAKIAQIKSHFKIVKEDPKDNIIVNTAYDGKADYIVSGDGHLLRLGRFKGSRIVKPKQMLEIISRKFPEIVVRL